MNRMKKGLKRRIALFLTLSIVIVLLGNETGLENIFCQVAKAADVEAITMPNIENVKFDNETEYATGSSIGSPQEPFEISSDVQLYYLASLIQANEYNKTYYLEEEQRYAKYSECSYVLTENITMSFSAWKRIGTVQYPFLGSFDGQNHTICNVQIYKQTLNETNVAYNSCVGIFGYVAEGTIKNVNISSSTVVDMEESSAFDHMGILIGAVSEGGNITVENCHILDNCALYIETTAFNPVTTDRDTFSEEEYCSSMAGGLIGGVLENSDISSAVGNITIKGCTNNAVVICDGLKNVGGIIGGLKNGSISDCSNKNTVKGNRNVGGIVGKTDKTVSIGECSNEGEVTGIEYTEDIRSNFADNVKKNSYENCWGSDFTAQKAVEKYGSGYYIGGIAGYSEGAIEKAANKGDITGSSNVGGIAGAAGDYVCESANKGKVATATYSGYTIEFPYGNGAEAVPVTFESAEKNVGGIAGSILSDGNYITDCYNQGIVSGKENTGGILGNANVIESEEIYPVLYSYSAQKENGSLINTDGANELIGTGQKTLYSYYLADIDNTQEDNKEGDGTLTAKSEREFSSGEVCYFLDRGNDKTRGIWSQKIGTQDLPVFAREDSECFSVCQLTISTMFSETTWTRFNYCNVNDSVKIATGITLDENYNYIYYYVGTGGIDDLEEIDENEKITRNCHIAVKRELKSQSSDLDGISTATPSAITTSSPIIITPIETATPSPTPTIAPTLTMSPDVTPSVSPSPTLPVVIIPSDVPSEAPTEVPSSTPTMSPAVTPSANPTLPPSGFQTAAPTIKPSSTLKPGEKGSIVVRGEKKYKITGNNTATFNGTIAKTSKVSVPATITVSGKKIKVTEISEKAFENNKKISNVTVGKNVKIIRKNAFNKCTNLKKITFPTGIQTIGNKCFANCTKLKTISLPSSTKTIGNEAFKNCKSLKTITIGKKLKVKKGEVFSAGLREKNLFAGKLTLKISIGNGAFQSCKSLRSVIINTQVRVIGNSAFRNCRKLSAIVVRSLILRTVGKKALLGVSDCKISVPKKKYSPYKKLFKNKGQGKKVFVAKA